MQQLEDDWLFYVQKATRRWPRLTAAQLMTDPGSLEHLIRCIEAAYQLPGATIASDVQEWRATFSVSAHNTSPPRRRVVVTGSALAALRYNGPSKAYR